MTASVPPTSAPEPPARIHSLEALDENLTSPRPELVSAIQQLRSPLVVLGASGKMGPSLCVLARRAALASGHSLKIIAVSRFSDHRTRDWLEARSISTMAIDLLDRRAFDSLPDSENVVYLVGLKFGTAQNPSLTWAVNTLVPASVGERYARARIVALSTGNVYPLVSVKTAGATEQTPPAPVGEYANAALARERIFEHQSHAHGTAVVLLRLNYAVELRYGVLLDIARKVWNGTPIDLATGHFNCIWQTDANDRILRSFPLASSPPSPYNLTGTAVLSVRQVAEHFGGLLGRPVTFRGSESETALLSNAAQLSARLGEPPTELHRMLEWTAAWLKAGGSTYDKPTHFEERSGQF